MSPTNGTGKLHKALAYHRQAVAALEFALQLLHGRAEASSTRRADTTIDQALAIERTRKQARPQGARGRPKKTTPKLGAAALRAQRQRSFEALGMFDATEPRPLNTAGTSAPKLASLIRRGYLRRKGDGYVRTAKEYRV